jgi:hypothetical protein
MLMDSIRAQGLIYDCPQAYDIQVLKRILEAEVASKTRFIDLFRTQLLSLHCQRW